MEFSVIILRFILTFLLASLFGLERQRSHKPTGFGTFIFVALGACGLSIVAVIAEPQNPVPLLSAIVTGIGFLGAGALIKTSDKVFGFTTAVSIWIFAIFGLVIGIGQYLVGLLMYAFVWVVILFDKYFEKRGIGSYQKRLVLHTNKIVSEKDIRDIIDNNTKKHKLMNIEIDKKNNKLIITYIIEGVSDDLNRIPQKLYEQPWFGSCKIE